MTIAMLGIDIGKTWFHVVALDTRGKPVLREKMNRQKLLRFVFTCNATLIGMEACAGSQWLARRMMRAGHDVTMRFVPIRSIEQIDMQAVHRVRHLALKTSQNSVGRNLTLTSEPPVTPWPRDTIRSA